MAYPTWLAGWVAEALPRLPEEDFSDFGYLLESIGGWHVGCINHEENSTAVDAAKAAGYLTTRMHYAPVIPEGSEAFELTDAGIEAVGALRGPKAKAAALRMRQWYRDSQEKYRERTGG